MNKKTSRLLVSAICGLAAATATYFVHRNRDILFDWNWVRPVGAFRVEEDATLQSAAIAFLEKNGASPGQVCVGRWAGRDDLYVYMAAGCAAFAETLGEVRTSGDSNYHATRFRYHGEEIEHFEQPDETNFENSLRRLFPREAARRVLERLNEDDFKLQGIKKSDPSFAEPMQIPVASSPAITSQAEPSTQDGPLPTETSR